MNANVETIANPLNAQDLTESIKMLPPLPDVAQEILERLDDEFIDGNEIADIVARDPAISARLFALANSAYFGLQRPVSEMREIVNRVLGPDTVRSLAFALASERTFNLDECEKFDTRRFWHRALSCASSSKRIAAVVDDLDDDSRSFAYVAGLCHSLGLMVLACRYPAQTSDMLDGYERVEPESDKDFDTVVHDYFGVSMSEVTHALASHWKMPNVIIDAYQARANRSGADNLLAATINASIKSAQHMEKIGSEQGDTEPTSFSEEFPKIQEERLAKVALPNERQREATESTLSVILK